MGGIKVENKWIALVTDLDSYGLTTDDVATMIREYLIREIEDLYEGEELFENLDIELSEENADNLCRKLSGYMAYFREAREGLNEL
jgi:hypothetical protein